MTEYTKIEVGKMAPDFELPDQDGKLHKLSDYRGKTVLLYFYPKDDTPGCTKEACSIRDSQANFKNLTTVVLGGSVDSVESHKKFAEKYSLPFTLLSDEKKEVVNLYGVWGTKEIIGLEYQGLGTLRSSFLINPDGKIAKIYERVKPEIHTEEVLKDVAKN